MNPEILRNAWIEATPRRLIIMAVVLTLIFLAAYSVGERGGDGPNGGAVAVYATAAPLALLLLAFWGARNAAEGVLSEIKDRTWDFQRLSALSPLSMTFGKLFGPTLYVWFGAAICMIALLWGAQAAGPPPDVEQAFESMGQPVRSLRPAFDVATLALTGVIAQGAALAVALLHARGGGRIGGAASVLAVLSGLAAMWALQMLSTAVAVSSFQAEPQTAPLTWWGVSLRDPRTFLLATYGAFALWAVVAVWRLMRRELQMPSTPWAFVAFALFFAAYVAGFGSGLGAAEGVPAALAACLTAYAAFHALALLMGFVEPKNIMDLRRLDAAWRQGGITAAFARMPAYVIGAAFALLAVAAAVAIWAGGARTEDAMKAVLLVGSASGFLLRDLALIVLFALSPGPRRGSFAALVALALLYGVGGVFASVVGGDLTPALFVPTAQPLGPVLAWAQAGAALWLMRGRWTQALAGPQVSPA